MEMKIQKPETNHLLEVVHLTVGSTAPILILTPSHGLLFTARRSTNRSHQPALFALYSLHNSFETDPFLGEVGVRNVEWNVLGFFDFRVYVHLGVIRSDKG